MRSGALDHLEPNSSIAGGDPDLPETSPFIDQRRAGTSPLSRPTSIQTQACGFRPATDYYSDLGKVADGQFAMNVTPIG
jgi:hypothetical protein